MNLLKRMYGAFYTLLFTLFAFVCSIVPAHAALDLSSITIDVTPVETLAGIIVGAIAAIWAIKKVVKLANRS